jgi:hypothetical protein
MPRALKSGRSDRKSWFAFEHTSREIERDWGPIAKSQYSGALPLDCKKMGKNIAVMRAISRPVR